VQGKPLCDLRVSPDIEQLYLAPVRSAVDELLAREGLDMSRIAVVLPSQFSAAFNAELARRLDIPREKIVDLSGIGKDLFTNSLPFTLERVLRDGLARAGDVGLIVNVASGIQVGCATYHF
jgi:3-oxoacyl-[acyl-carrier-protein] synthase III